MNESVIYYTYTQPIHCSSNLSPAMTTPSTTHIKSFYDSFTQPLQEYMRAVIDVVENTAKIMHHMMLTPNPARAVEMEADIQALKTKDKLLNRHLDSIISKLGGKSAVSAAFREEIAGIDATIKDMSQERLELVLATARKMRYRYPYADVLIACDRVIEM